MDDNQTRNANTPGEKSGEIPGVDGAVREMEKNAIATERGAGVTEPGESAGDPAEVIPLGKEGGGAPEDAVRDTTES